MSKSEDQQITCGVIMPISAIDDCPESHWLDVKSIIYDSIQQAGFNPNLVSLANDVGIIQKRIIQNLYQNPIVVCDVSGKNPNVMFELGLRLAFDKATIIIKDDKTDYSFDTAPIEHLQYPRDLRYSEIIKFKHELKEKINNTYSASVSDPNFSTFLKHFGEFKTAKIETKEVSERDVMLDEILETTRRNSKILESITRDRQENKGNKLRSIIMKEQIHQLISKLSLVENAIGNIEQNIKSMRGKEPNDDNDLKQHENELKHLLNERDKYRAELAALQENLASVS